MSQFKDCYIAGSEQAHSHDFKVKYVNLEK
jgi:hypothetical protein